MAAYQHFYDLALTCALKHPLAARFYAGVALGVARELGRPDLTLSALDLLGDLS